MDKKYVLYHYWRSSASWRVRWALEIKKISYEARVVNLLKGEEKSTEFLEKNPAGYVPCLVLEEQGRKYFLSESLPIIEFLEEKHPEHSLLPGSSFDKAFMRQLAETINAGTQPLQNLDVFRYHSSEKNKQDEWIQHWIKRGLGIYEKLLGNKGGTTTAFSCTDTPSLADICLIPQCYSALRFQVDLSQFPLCEKIYEYAMGTPECLAASPDAHKPKES